MKRSFTILLFLAILGSGVFYYHKIYKVESFSPEYFLPEEILFYLHQKDLEALIDKFTNTPLAQTLASIDFVKLSLDLEFSFDTVNNIRKLRDFIGSPQASLIFDEFLSEEFSVALLQQHESKSLDVFLRKNLILFCKPKHGTTIPRIVSSMVSDVVSTKTTQYGEHVIYKIFLDKEITLTGVAAEKMLFFSLEERTIRKALDRYDEKTANLSEDYFFQELQEESSKALFFSFFKIESLLSQFRLFVGSQSGIAGELIKSLDNLDGFIAGAFSAYKEKHYTKNKLKLFFNQHELDKHTAHFLSIPPDKEPVIKYVPHDTFLYYWTNTFDLRTMWEIYASESGEEDMLLNDFEKSVEQMTGLPFTELLELPDNTISVILREASTIDLVPVPNFSFIFDMKDTVKAQKSIERLLIKNKIPHKKDKYKGVEYTYWGEDIQKGLQPVYAFHDSNLYISSSVKMQTEIIDTISSGNNLIGTDNFQVSGKQLLEINNSCLYIELSALIEVIKKMAIWSGTMIAIQNRNAAHKSKILIDGLIIPLLDGLKMYSTFASRSYTEKGVVTVESNLMMHEE